MRATRRRRSKQAVVDRGLCATECFFPCRHDVHVGTLGQGVVGHQIELVPLRLVATCNRVVGFASREGVAGDQSRCWRQRILTPQFEVIERNRAGRAVSIVELGVGIVRTDLRCANRVGTASADNLAVGRRCTNITEGAELRRIVGRSNPVTIGKLRCGITCVFVSSRQIDRAVRVARTQAEHAVLAKFAGDSAEGVHTAKGQAVVRGAGILDCIVDAVCIVAIVDVAGVRVISTPVTVQRCRLYIVVDGVILTTDRHSTPASTRQTDVSLATEVEAALTGFTGKRVETVFQLEHRLQAAAQIFATFQAPTATLGNPALHCKQGLAFGVIYIGQTSVNNAVQRHTALCVNRTSECTQRCESEKRLFHRMISNQLCHLVI